MSQLLRYHTDLSQRLARTIKAEPLWPLVLVMVAELLTLKAVLHTYPCGYRLPKLVLDNSKPLSPLIHQCSPWTGRVPPLQTSGSKGEVGWGEESTGLLVLWTHGTKADRGSFPYYHGCKARFSGCFQGGCVSCWTSGGSCSQHLPRWVCFSHKHE